MQAADLPLYPKHRIHRHLSELIRLATPVAISRTSIMMLATVDIAMLGRIGAEEVAFYTLGLSPFIILMVTGIGLLLGTAVSTGHALGAEKLKEAGAVWRRSLPYALLLGLLFAILCQFAEPFFKATGQEESLSIGAAKVSSMLGYSLVPTMLYITCSFFLEALKRPGPVMVISIIANIFNVAGNYFFIYGTSDTLGLGAEGAALSTAIARTFMGVGLFFYIWWLRQREVFGIRDRLKPGWVKGGKLQRYYGYAGGLSLGLETCVFGFMNILAGWMGTKELAIYGISMNLLAMLFMVALGLSSATGIRVSIAHGRRDWSDRTLAGWTGLAVTIVVLATLGGIVALWPETWVRIYFDDPDLIQLSIPVFLVIGFIMVADGMQVVMSQALRAAADSWAPTFMSFISYVLIMAPLGWVFGVYYDLGPIGLFAAIGTGSIAASIVLTGRWVWLFRRDLQSQTN